MQVSPITSQYKPYKPTFKSNERIFRDNLGNILYRNTTNFFRDDLDWKKFGNFIQKKYKDTNKVNFYCYGCSDGSEPVSIVMLLKELFEDYDKFLPIIAKDIDETMIYNAKKGIIPIDYNDFEAINKYTNGKFDTYIKTSKYLLGFDPIPARIHPDIISKINFSLANITEDINNIQQKNTILFCRNLWPYLNSEQDIIKLVDNLSEKLDSTSTIVIGNYDERVSLNKLLQSRNFQKVNDLSNVYEKPIKIYY